MTAARTLRRIAAVILITACAASWALLSASLALDWPKGVTMFAVFAAAFSTEAAIWAGAALLGWTALAHRRGLFAHLTGRSHGGYD